MLHLALDYFFVVFHSLLIIFNLFGWIFKSLRKVNLVTLLLTGLSWVGLGLFYGLGYCPLTDWHWEVLSKMGKKPQTHSYVAYLFERLLDIKISSTFADTITLLGFLLAIFLSIVFNLKDWRISRRNR